MKYLLFLVLFFTTGIVVSQDLTAVFKAKSEVFKTERGMPASQFEIVANDTQIQHMIDYTNPMFDHLKFVHTKQSDNRYDILIYFRPSKDFDYMKSILINLGVSFVKIGEQIISIEELSE
jgi:hypothetical protein